MSQSRGRGRVVSLNVSNGGVPKLPIERAALGELGLEGDKHRARFHGGPTAALCLFSMETIERLRAEGHPIYPGAIDARVYARVVEGGTVATGDGVELVRG